MKIMSHVTMNLNILTARNQVSVHRYDYKSKSFLHE